MTTRFLLCQSASFALLDKDGTLYYRAWNSEDRIAIGPDGNRWGLLQSLMLHHGYVPVIGMSDEAEPTIPDGLHWPKLVLLEQPDGSCVYKIVELTERGILPGKHPLD